MTPRQTVLSLLTILILTVSVGPALIGSVQEQQISDRLELYQTDLLLQANELRVDAGEDQWVPVRAALVGQSPIKAGLKAYETTRATAQTRLEELEDTLASLTATMAETEQALEAAEVGAIAPINGSSLGDATRRDGASDGTLDGNAGDAAIAIKSALKISAAQAKVSAQQTVIDQLDLRIGLLQAQQDERSAALSTWDALANSNTVAPVATTLAGLWSTPPTITPMAREQIDQAFTGWFRTRALTQLFTVAEDAIALADLQQTSQAIAQQTVRKLAIISAGPILGGLIGVGLLIFLVIQRVVSGPSAILAEGQAQQWDAPWNWDITWQVLIVGFFFVGQLVIPVLFQIVKPLITTLGQSAGLVGGRLTALSTLMVYSLMSLGTLGVLYASIREHTPFKLGWFRFDFTRWWWVWGLGGYLAAVPLVIGISVVNQGIWQGQGGSNPLLQTVLEEGDGVALGVFFFTAAIAAPIFEEILFRGFLLPSLTKYMSTWSAIGLSSFLFAAAHLSVSEILPLMVLGMVLGFVYTRSNNLFSSMMVHSLWNSATMVGLLVLGSSI